MRHGGSCVLELKGHRIDGPNGPCTDPPVPSNAGYDMGILHDWIVDEDKIVEKLKSIIEGDLNKLSLETTNKVDQVISEARERAIETVKNSMNEAVSSFLAGKRGMRVIKEKIAELLVEQEQDLEAYRVRVRHDLEIQAGLLMSESVSRMRREWAEFFDGIQKDAEQKQGLLTERVRREITSSAIDAESAFESKKSHILAALGNLQKKTEVLNDRLEFVVEQMRDETREMVLRQAGIAAAEVLNDHVRGMLRSEVQRALREPMTRIDGISARNLSDLHGVSVREARRMKRRRATNQLFGQNSE